MAMGGGLIMAGPILESSLTTFAATPDLIGLYAEVTTVTDEVLSGTTRHLRICHLRQF